MADNVIDLESARKRTDDYLVRGTAAEGAVRAIAVTARNTVQTADELHHTSPLVTAALGRLMMGAQMMGALTKNEGELITLAVSGDGPIGGLTVTANNKGQVKGYAKHPNVWLPLNEGGKLDVGVGIGAGTLTVIRDLPGSDPYTSTIELATGEIGDDLTAYFAISDQIPTSVGVGVLVDTDLSVRQAGGFIVQLMPGYSDALVDQLEANLKDVSSVTDFLEQGMGPREILQTILSGMDFEELEEMPAEFFCGCNEERAIRAVISLGEDELSDLIAKGEPAEVLCHFCGKRYEFPPEVLQELLDCAK